MAAGEMAEGEFAAFLAQACRNLAAFSAAGSFTTSALTGAIWANCSPPVERSMAS
jgi:hypothetical protein